MDRAILLDHLALAEKHVALGAENVAAQIAAIAALKRGGHHAGFAEGVLQTFQECQSIFVADRDRLLAMFVSD